MSAWIPVGERLPDTDATVLAALNDQEAPVWLAYHDAEGWFSVDAGSVEVTHWMPLPASPTEVS